MGIIAGKVGYKLLRRLVKVCPDNNVTTAYDGVSKMEVLFGPDIWRQLADKTVVDFGCEAGIEAIDMVLATNKKRVGVFGFSFKAGTDDLRESPMVTLIETLIGKGLQLQIYDRDVSLARLFGANKEYIERQIPHIAQLMRTSIDEVLEFAEVLVLGNKNEEFKAIEQTRREGQVVIDLVRLFDTTSSDCYQGICW